MQITINEKICKVANGDVETSSSEPKLYPDLFESKGFEQVDVLSQLKANIAIIEDLQFSLNCLMGEIRYHLEK